MKAEIYNFPNTIIKRNKYTMLFLKEKEPHQEFICWYIGHETGRLLGLYWDTKYEKVFIRAYFQNNDELEIDKNGDGWIDWQKAWDCIRLSSEVYCSEYLAFFIGIQKAPPKKETCKILQFPSAKLKKNKSRKKEKTAI